MTNITPTIRVLSNVGEEMVIEANVASGSLLVSSADTIDCSGASMITSGDEVKIMCAMEDTSGKVLTPFVTWTDSTRKFAFDGGVAGTNIDTTLRASSADNVRIEFKICKD